MEREEEDISPYDARDCVKKVITPFQEKKKKTLKNLLHEL